MLEEIIEEGADRGDGRKPRHLVPARGDRGFENVGGELKSEASDKPTAQAQPNLTLVVAVARREHRPQALEEGLDRADDDSWAVMATPGGNYVWLLSRRPSLPPKVEAAALARVHDYLLAWPEHTAALLAVELCSLTLPVTQSTTADLVVSGLFGDGAAGLVARGGEKAAASSGPQVIATRSEVYPDTADVLAWRLGSDGFRIVLTADLADVVARHLSASVSTFLEEQGLTVDEIRSWVCHPGGPRVIDAVQESFGLPDSALEASRRSLAAVGNMSSVSVLHVLQETIDTCPPPPGSAGLLIGLGPGVSAELVLLRW